MGGAERRAGKNNQRGRCPRTPCLFCGSLRTLMSPSRQQAQGVQCCSSSLSCELHVRPRARAPACARARACACLCSSSRGPWPVWGKEGQSGWEGQSRWAEQTLRRLSDGRVKIINGGAAPAPPACSAAGFGRRALRALRIAIWPSISPRGTTHPYGPEPWRKHWPHPVTLPAQARAQVHAAPCLRFSFNSLIPGRWRPLCLVGVHGDLLCIHVLPTVIFFKHHQWMQTNKFNRQGKGSLRYLGNLFAFTVAPQRIFVSPDGG